MPAIGETIGSYQILKQLGAGAMGEVYLAEHRHLKRKAAVKLLAPELVGRPDLLERFFLEARATSAIAHPGIVQVFDCEVDATGRPYIVMEFLDGETLAAVLARRGALPGLTAARLGRGMAEALEAAHAKGIVHRDLKPENIFVQAQPPDSVKLVDFGIAKLAGDFRAGQVHQTRSGAIMGTPLYMSPEQCRDSANLDSRTDLYSLGCVLFEMLTGRPPFTHANLGDLVVAHMTEAPPDARAVNPSVPPPLAALVAELLRKNPAERPAGMRAVAERLAAFIGGMTTVPDALPRGPVATQPPTKSKTTFGDSAAELVDGAAPPRKRSSMTLVVAAVLGLGAGGIAVSRLHINHGENQSEAAPPPAAVPSPPTSAQLPHAAAPPTPAGEIAPPAGAVAPAPSPTAAPPPSSTPAPPPAKEEAAVVKKKGRHHGAELASAATRPPEEAPAASPSASSPEPSVAAAAGPLDLSGAWEGPWSDLDHHQTGRLYLQVGGGGQVSGWLSNATAGRSYRIAGRAERPGDLALACQCPVNQGFDVHVLLHQAEGGELKGRVSLSAAAGVFGQSHVVLHRTTAR
ncbi:MAG TPA: serine/threonine-protein kinase [Polyangia bacterium]|nr:serine/threonine-protein kinase [Polyangia bacterium]